MLALSPSTFRPCNQNLIFTAPTAYSRYSKTTSFRDKVHNLEFSLSLHTIGQRSSKVLEGLGAKNAKTAWHPRCQMTSMSVVSSVLIKTHIVSQDVFHLADRAHMFSHPPPDSNPESLPQEWEFTGRISGGRLLADALGLLIPVPSF